jgi:nucleoside 2-deoxyribosyltransferase
VERLIADSEAASSCKRRPNVFLAAPYSQWMDWSRKQVVPKWRGRLENLRTALIAEGADVFSAHHNEQWGQSWLEPEQCTPLDFAAVQASDVVCAVLGNPLSGGVAIELGWASAMGKQIVVALPTEVAITPLVAGLDTIAHTELYPEDPQWSPEFISGLARRTIEICRPTSGESRKSGTSAPARRFDRPMR